ncbi:4-alpha-glucanotransferase [Flaviaesturariibacter flavus]|uniref:4-alpha-glucanotransferase n=1 Tax=Flaviaesturariibacter flavus TaxID=2502780 RepID=A0A4R1BH56_9BACT|nr:4-alpha-glucanotransferase [Flaviaesturariibacter flavus]TCJ16531.1 4-alpha-glucanotransferase [Flaviaesturariibacter flavus]
MKIDFYLRFHTRYGQALSVSGNLLSLGGNDGAAALPMRFINQDFWHASIEVDPAQSETLHYHYILTNEHGERSTDAEKDRVVNIAKKDTEHLVLIDTWNYAGEFENSFFTAPFREVFFNNGGSPRLRKAKRYTHQFRVKAPLLGPQECVCLLGEGAALGNWNSEAPVLLERSGDWWTVKLDLTNASFPLTYKYGVYNFKKADFAAYEEGDNRTLFSPDVADTITIAHDGFVRLPNSTWKGAGIAIPVFSLRSQASFGVGEFADLKVLADWAAGVGMKLIQLLPVNDTSATFTRADSYPYAAISAFALHPQYISLSRVAGKKGAASLKSLAKKQKQLNALTEIDYEEVMKIKMQVLHELYEAAGDDFTKESDYRDFVAANNHWLKAYAVFSHLRDKFGTSDYNQWKTNAVYNEEEIDKLISARSKTAKDIRFYFWLQYHLHLQLRDAVEYIHKKGIVVKGDIPIGIYRYSVDAWQEPELYHMDWQAGAPPDDFAVKGQNWGFPTYNWDRMQEDGFRWWKRRFEQMSNYFDAFRIDHILGFFRIWSIPMDAVEGIMGRFIPALPIRHHEFGERGIWFDYDRYCRPYITDAVLGEIFGGSAEFVRQHFLRDNGRGGYDLLESYNTQRKIEAHFHLQDENDQNAALKQGLFDLVSNVLFFEEPGSNGTNYHFRIAIESTTSFRHLDGALQARLKELYVDYFFRRQDEFWKHEALRKLPALKEATNMLICGEDLGMVPASVPDVMKDLGILSLEIQRMPKDPKTEFFHPKTAPYLSVVTPSTHDMSTIRGWWEEDRDRTQRFYNQVLESHGTAPYFCDSWINRAIVLQHLYSPAMWSIFQLQDLLGMSDELRRDDPAAERINQPADPKHYWRYRMHLTLEQLLKEKEFNTEVRDYITNSGR